MTRRKWGFRSKKQIPLFLIWDEEIDVTSGEVVFAWVVFNSRDWIGI